VAVNYFSHIGIAVTDIAVTRRFFVGGLGFTVVGDGRGDGRYRGKAVSGELGRQVAAILELDEFDVVTDFLERDRHVIELVEYHAPRPTPDARRPANVCGLTHLCFLVEDVDAVAGRLEDLGGTPLAATRVTMHLADGRRQARVLCLDPDRGTRIELVEAVA
jgi:catechol 2,3-dioxygenase-like lactoylglutathione lyase family enzyme